MNYLSIDFKIECIIKEIRTCQLHCCLQPCKENNWKMNNGKKTMHSHERLWRIHDGLYDLSGYIDKHPGGRQWLEITKGTDCTEAFESHHLGKKAEKILPKFFVKVASAPRGVDYTFLKDGFYNSLKTEVKCVLKTLPIKKIEAQSKIIMDAIACTTLLLVAAAAYGSSYSIATVSGVLLAFTANAGHNFFHKKDNWRMYYIHLSLLSVRDWRIYHCLSHHVYTNTLQDLELTSFEPFFDFTPDPKKNWIQRFLSWVYYPFIHATMCHAEFFSRCYHEILSMSELLIALVIPPLLFVANGGYIISAILMWTWIICVASLFQNITDIVATHRSVDFVQGDAPRRDRDWGLAQIDTTKDNQRLIGNHFFALIMFGDHTLHHLFPTVDHGVLKYLYPVFLRTCEKFNVKWETQSSFRLATAEFRALARNEPNRNPPHHATLHGNATMQDYSEISHLQKT
ncbi:cytochrome b5-related protein [Bemisia tabaci]